MDWPEFIRSSARVSRNGVGPSARIVQPSRRSQRAHPTLWRRAHARSAQRTLPPNHG